MKNRKITQVMIQRDQNEVNVLSAQQDTGHDTKGVKYKGAPCTRSISVVDPTLWWGRVSPLSPKFFGEPKQIFEISATLELPTAKTLQCIRTKLAGFVDMWEVNKSP